MRGVQRSYRDHHPQDGPSFLLDLALQLPVSFDAIPIPCSIPSVNVVQSLGEHIATLSVDGEHRVPTWISERARRMAVSR